MQEANWLIMSLSKVAVEMLRNHISAGFQNPDKSN